MQYTYILYAPHTHAKIKNKNKKIFGAPDIAIMEAENFSRCFASSGLWSFDKWWCIQMSCKELCWLESPNVMRLNSSRHFHGYTNLCLWERKKMFISINWIRYSHRNSKDTLNVRNSFRSTEMMEMLTSIKTKLHLSVFNVHSTDHMKHFICGFINGWLITVRYFSGQ